MKLEVRDLHKSFGEKEVLKGISFSIESGKALGLLGRNGAGKTTTIRILMDVFRANSGDIFMNDNKFVPKNFKIGYLPEERGLYPKRTVTEQMTYLARLRGATKKEALKSTEKWLNRLEISEYKDKLLETLSKGNQQKVQLAATLVSDPDIVILDEPFSGLDPVNSQILQDVVNELIEIGKIVIFSSHQMSYVEEFCKDIVIINNGEVVLSGDLMEIKREFGNNQIVISGKDIDTDEMTEFVKTKMSDIVECTGISRDCVIVKLINNSTKKDILKRLCEFDDFELEHLEDYKPSLNEIFVAKVGEQHEEI